MASWESDTEQLSFTPSAKHLTHYLALRDHDLRELQRELMRHGLSVSRSPGERVLITLGTAEYALAAPYDSSVDAGSPPSSAEFFSSEMQLRASTCRLLGGR
jgi:pyruvate kinase